MYPTKRTKYLYWVFYPSYDRLALTYLKNSALHGFLDVSPLYLRADNHAKDCMHYCIDRHQGTALDMAAYLIYEALLDESSETYLYQWD